MTGAILVGLAVALIQGAPPPSAAAAQQSPWQVSVISAERVKPGTKDEPSVQAGEAILKVGVKFQYAGPEGEVLAPVLKVRESSGKEHVMLGNLQGSEGFDCFGWLMSASHVVFGEKPKTLASSTISRCKGAVFYYYFVLPNNPQYPLALMFADAKPISLTVK